MTAEITRTVEILAFVTTRQAGSVARAAARLGPSRSAVADGRLTALPAGKGGADSPVVYPSRRNPLAKVCAFLVLAAR